MRLSGNETWVLAGTQGPLIWANIWGQLQNIHLSDCSRLRIEYDIIEQDNFYECQYYD